MNNFHQPYQTPPCYITKSIQHRIISLQSNIYQFTGTAYTELCSPRFHTHHRSHIHRIFTLHVCRVARRAPICVLMRLIYSRQTANTKLRLIRHNRSVVVASPLPLYARGMCVWAYNLKCCAQDCSTTIHAAAGKGNHCYSADLLLRFQHRPIEHRARSRRDQ